MLHGREGYSLLSMEDSHQSRYLLQRKKDLHQGRYVLQHKEDPHQSRWIFPKELQPVEITCWSTRSLSTSRKKWHSFAMVPGNSLWRTPAFVGIRASEPNNDTSRLISVT